MSLKIRSRSELALIILIVVLAIPGIIITFLFGMRGGGWIYSIPDQWPWVRWLLERYQDAPLHLFLIGDGLIVIALIVVYKIKFGRRT